MQKKSAARTAGSRGAPQYDLCLCITGMTSRSRLALGNIQKICDTYLEGRYRLEVVDLYQQPEFAAQHQVIATPTLVKRQPSPLRRLVGDLSNSAAVVKKLGIIEGAKGYE